MGLIASILASVQLCCVPPAAPPPPASIPGDTAIHDPAAIVRPSAPRWVVYGSHGKTLVSDGQGGYSPGARSHAAQPWWPSYIDPGPASMPFWAPDVSFHEGRWWMYYAVSRTGSARSAIGLATSATGLPGSWSDQGPVISSDGSQPYNAIDPNLLVDADGNWWLTFGSFWHGIYMAALDPATGKLPPGLPQLHHLAERPPLPGEPFDPHQNAIEAPFVFEHAGSYYLFVSFDRCCNGAGSTYNIRVGRSSLPTGPFVDAASVEMLQGGGTPVLAGHGPFAGPGGQSVLRDAAADRDLLVYHYYDARRGGQAALGVNPLGWKLNGFPFVR